LGADLRASPWGKGITGAKLGSFAEIGAILVDVLGLQADITQNAQIAKKALLFMNCILKGRNSVKIGSDQGVLTGR
jgi:hypothetical protein